MNTTAPITAPTRTLLASLALAALLPTASAQDLLLVNLADTHSAYDAYPRVLTQVQQIVADHPDTPVYMLFNGDLFEPGNVVAARSEGEVDWMFLEALHEAAPVILNLGNHEFDFDDPADFVTQAEARGITVIGSVFGTDGQLLAPALTTLQVGDVSVDIVGVATDALNTYQADARDQIVLPEPVAWTDATFNRLAQSDVSVLLTHAGVVADRTIMTALPGNVLFAVGGHDHLVLREDVSREGVAEPLLYIHTGFKGERLTVASVTFSERDEDGHVSADLTLTDYVIDDSLSPDATFATEIDNARMTYLDADDLDTVGIVTETYTVREAAQWAVDTLADMTDADVALLNHTSFGAGLDAGPLPRYRFNAFLRFDNDVMVTEVDGETLQQILARSNQGTDTPLSERTGDFVYSNDVDPQPGETYRLVTSSWVTLPFNVMGYLGTDALTFEQIEGVTTKGLLAESLAANETP
ncbi:MAG: metallophosphoesterase [Trueperaceae bacterium]|nr:metallophosphoesterase [Trueperaceae bacterium]